VPQTPEWETFIRTSSPESGRFLLLDCFMLPEGVPLKTVNDIAIDLICFFSFF
jgi:hypothetical protein